jgi:hypothetical protein
MIELLPWLYRIETALGDNLLALYLIFGEHTLLIDSGGWGRLPSRSNGLGQRWTSGAALCRRPAGAA